MKMFPNSSFPFAASSAAVSVLLFCSVAVSHAAAPEEKTEPGTPARRTEMKMEKTEIKKTSGQQENQKLKMNFEARTYIHVKIPMRDGVQLCADVYLPPDEGRYPVILTRSPYGATTSRNGGALDWIKRGFAFVGVDTRGRFHSEGDCNPSRDEKNDGYDTLEWIASQPWCDGNVGMVGGSYVAVTQLAAASSGHPVLKAVAPSAISSCMFDCYYNGGALLLSFMPSWHIGMCSRGKTPPVPPDWKTLQQELPVATLDDRAGLPAQAWKDIVAHPFYDEYWKEIDLKTSLPDLRAAMFIQGSWYDLLGRGSIQIYQDIVNHPDVPADVKRHTYLRIGPWGHGVNTPEGVYDFGDASMVTEDLEIDFLQNLLTGKNPSTDREPGRIAYFTMGLNQWQYTDQWPPAHVRDVKYYLGSRGGANSRSGDGVLSLNPPSADGAPESGKDHFRYDPADPVPTCGGRMVGSGGRKDQSAVEDRKDVLVYTLPALEEDLEVTGEVRLKLFISSTAPDTDFTAKLVDVSPDGVPMNVCDGILRVRYRNGLDKPGVLMEPGKVYELDIYVDVTSHLFRKGHCVRLEVSSSNYPHYTRNLNTAEDPAFGTQMRVAEQTVYHSNEYPSHLILPVASKKPQP